MRVLLMNPNASRAVTEMMCRIAARSLPHPPEPWTAPRGPDLISTPDALDAAAAGISAAVLEPGLDGIIVSAFGDPGAAELARRIEIPVVGIGAAAARACAAPFAVATTTPALAGRIDALMAAQAGRNPYLGCFLTEEDPDALMADERALDGALSDAIRRAASAGAQQVIIGGGPLGAAADRLAPSSPVTLVNPIRAAAEEIRALLS
ncbi:aspartate/glutamate racemase family protein [Poseidonocella sedimentorum]|uniref:Asp/Glu/hydantoin racemase n=1 Tax=Poseidonocella sedimentorum TaxID=871652 RepID=A0A1I6D7T8_9RHOB|nr:aspartate/glutamate racemase family protein [Poseidonocella sedimentorum]SFR01478.1 Asp/Glu/hydantoin racemase [Poseidonocella sedimentorum]